MSKKTLKLHLNILPFVAVFAISATSGLIPKKDVNDAPVGYLSRSLGDNREEKIIALKTFFEGFNSPLMDNAETFVDVANKYGLDYRLLPAIACMESSCGKKLIEGSYNPFGWGIYGNNAIYFKSYDEAIETVGKGIKEKYVERGLTTPEKIAPVYTPPNPVGWKNGVNYFIGKIDGFKESDNTILFSS